jgi:hypothetical protein
MHVLGEDIHLVEMESVSHLYAKGLTHEDPYRVSRVVAGVILILFDSQSIRCFEKDANLLIQFFLHFTPPFAKVHADEQK